MLWSSGPSAYSFWSLCTANGKVYALSPGSDANILFWIIDALNGDSIVPIDLGGESISGSVYLDDDGVLYVGVSGRILISTDGGATFAEKPFGLSSVGEIQSKRGQTWAGLIGSGAAVFQSGTSSWRTVGTELDRGLCYTIGSIAIVSPTSVVLSGGPEPEVAISTDGGASFAFSWFGPDDGSICWSRTVVEDSQGTLFMMASCSDAADVNSFMRVYRSEDQGTTWLQHAEFLPTTTGRPRGTLVVDEGRSCSWAALRHHDPAAACLWQGDVQCQNWVPLDVMDFDMLVDAFLDETGNFYVIGRGASGIGIYRLGADESWSYIPIPPGLGEWGWPTSIVVDADGSFWLSSEFGLFYTPNGGSSWIRFTKEDGLASNIVNCMAVEGRGNDRVIWVGTALGASRGIFAGE